MIRHQQWEKSGDENCQEFRETQEVFYEKSKVSTRIISKEIT